MGEAPAGKIRFGHYEADVAAGELRRNGRLLRMQEQPFQILAALLERPGAIVTRDELRERLWAGDTFVDFDQGLNTAINKLREALGDSAATPRFVETVPKRGYRFTFPVEADLTNQPAKDTPKPVGPAWRNRRLLLAMAVCLGIGVVAAAAALLLRGPVPNAQLPLRRFTLRLPAPLSPVSRIFAVAAISPDGRRIAFIAGEGAGKLWIQDLGQQQPRPIEGSEGAYEPFWSPESDSIGFAATNRELKKLAIKGGAPTTLCKLSGAGFYGATWSPDGRSIVFSDGAPPNLYEVSASGGASSLLLASDQIKGQPEGTQSDGKPGYAASPHFLPEQAGARVLVFSVGHIERTLMVLDLKSGRQEALVRGSRGFYSPTGHLVYRSTTGTPSLWALPFSLDTLKPAGESFRIASNAENPTLAADGTLVYADATPMQLVWKDRRGGKTGAVGQPVELAGYPTLSSDERFVAVEALENENLDVWIYDISRGGKTRISSDLATDVVPVWSPNGEELAFSSNRAGNVDIFIRRADGGPEEKRVAATPYNDRASDWSRDGKYIVYSLLDPKSRNDLWYLERGEKGAWQPHEFLRTSSNERSPKLSPDGRYVAYVSDESGRNEVYVRPFPRGDRKWAVSTQGGSQLRWSRNGREVFYSEAGTLMAVEVRTTPEFAVSPPTRLFSHEAFTIWPDANYDVSADGQRILLPESVGGVDRQIHVVQNWFADFRGR